MRRVIVSVVGIVCAAVVSACSPAPPAPPAGPTPAEMVAAANAIDQRFAEAFNKGDVDAAMAGYWNSPDLVSIGPEGMGTKGWDACKAGLAETFKAMPGAKFELVDTHNDVHGDVVLGWGTWRLAMTTPQGPLVVEGRYTDVKARRDGKWVIVMDHASAPLPPPPSAPVKK